MSIAPFETPVVPPVYCSTAMSSSAMATRGGSGGVAATSFRNRCTSAAGSTWAMAGGLVRRSFSGASCFSGKRRYSGIEATM